MAAPTTHPVELGFLPEAYAIPDPEHPGLLRAGPRTGGPYGDADVDPHRCAAADWQRVGDIGVDLLDGGFDCVDLSPLTELQTTLAAVRAAGRLTDDDAAVIRESLLGAELRCTSGRTVTIQFVADEGLILRTAGPNRMQLVPTHSNGMNDHGAATSVHADQDVFGTPLTQLMDGRAPELFRHDSPDGANPDSTLMLCNLWIPLQQVAQPLVLADGRTTDRRHKQLRYGLPTGSFLERDDDMAVNDIWRFLHDPDQRWYFRSDMDHRTALVFDTCSTPHGAGILPGEDVAERCFRALRDAEEAAEGGDAAAVGAALDGVDATLPDDVTPALRDAVAALLAVIAEARSAPGSTDWVERSRAARRGVVRMSVELRVVGTVTP